MLLLLNNVEKGNKIPTFHSCHIGGFVLIKFTIPEKITIQIILFYTSCT